MTETELKTAEFQAMLRQEARAFPPLDRRHKEIHDAICLATARANRRAFISAKDRVVKTGPAGGDTCA